MVSVKSCSFSDADLFLNSDPHCSLDLFNTGVCMRIKDARMDVFTNKFHAPLTFELWDLSSGTLG